MSRTLYRPLIEEVLQAWANREVTIILDGCFIRQKALQILRAIIAMATAIRTGIYPSVRTFIERFEVSERTVPS